MAMPFPTLGAYDAWGHRGMFIGEVHSGKAPDPQATIVRMLELWPIITANVDVLFLEAFDAGATPDTSSQKAVLSDLARTTGVKAWEWEAGGRAWVAPAYRSMGALAKRTNTPLIGVDLYPHPWWTRHTYNPTYRRMLVQFRMEPALHQAWATVIRQELERTNKSRFAVLGGTGHGPELAKAMPGLVLYALDDQGEFKQYTRIAPPAWGPVFLP